MRYCIRRHDGSSSRQRAAHQNSIRTQANGQMFSTRTLRLFRRRQRQVRKHFRVSVDAFRTDLGAFVALGSRQSPARMITAPIRWSHLPTLTFAYIRTVLMFRKCSSLKALSLAVLQYASTTRYLCEIDHELFRS